MSRKTISLAITALSAVLLTLPAAEISQAGEGGTVKARQHRQLPGAAGLAPTFHPGPLPDRIPRLGTFSGGISAYRDRGNGIYFSVSGQASAAGARQEPKGPKIITIMPSGESQACGDSTDVCVIRP